MVAAEGGRARAQRGRREPSLQAYATFFFPPLVLLCSGGADAERVAAGEVFGELAAPLRRASCPTALAVSTSLQRRVYRDVWFGAQRGRRFGEVRSNVLNSALSLLAAVSLKC